MDSVKEVDGYLKKRRRVAEAILRTMEKQPFADWYNGLKGSHFIDHIEGNYDHEALRGRIILRERVLKEIESQFSKVFEEL